MAPRFLIPAALACAAAASAAAGPANGAPTYTRFMGADIYVGQGGEPRPVRDVNGSSWVVIVDGKPQLVSAKNGPISMKITSSVKLTEVSASIDNLKAAGAYTPGNDPAVKMARALNQAGDLTAGATAAANQSAALSLSEVSGIVGNTSSSTTTGGTSGTNSSQPVQSVSGGTVGGDVTFFKGATGDGAGYDALEVTFDISAARTLDEPYLVMITRFHERDAEPGTFRNLVYAKALDPILPKAESVHFVQTGFPVGFELKGFELHLYNEGEEVATNYSPQRETLTTDGAFEYVKEAYLKAHKGETLAAAPVLAGTLPADLQDRLAKGMYAGTIYVRVSKDGLAEESYADAACSKRIEDPYVESVVRSIRFKPALSNGRPVEGTSSVRLAQLKS